MFKPYVIVLGTTYTIKVKSYTEDKTFEDRSIDGYCDGYTHEIAVCDLATIPKWECEPKKTIRATMKQILQHEITHAFFYESELADSSVTVNGPWAKNEEMIDWLAFNGPKIYSAWRFAGAL